MSSPVSLSAASTVPAAVWFSAASNAAEEENVGAALASSSLIVPVAATFAPSVALSGFAIVSVKVSALSLASSSVVWTSIVPVLLPASISSMPLAAVKSVPEVASSPVATDVA